jgi:putative ABC transport system permease protein
LAVIGMAVATAAVAIGGMASGSDRSLPATDHRDKADLTVQQHGVKQKLTGVLDAALGKQIATVPGVSAVESTLVDFIAMDELGRVGVLVQGGEADSPLMRGLKILPGGRPLKPSDKNSLMLGERLAIDLKKKVGERVNIFDGRTYKVVGIFKSKPVYENGSMVVLLADLQRFMGRPSQVSGFMVMVEHPDDKAEVQRIRHAIETLDKNLEVSAVPPPRPLRPPR